MQEESPLVTLAKWVRQALPARVAAASALMVLGGLLEGASAFALLPLLGSLGVPGTQTGFPHAPGGLLGATLLFGALQAAATLLDWLNARQAGTLTIRFVAWLRNELLGGLVRMRWRTLRTKDAGALQSLLTWEADRAGQALFALVTATSGITVTAIYLAVAIFAQPLLAGLMIAAGALLAALLYPLSRRVSEAARNLAANYQQMGSGAHQWLANLRLAILDGTGSLHGAFSSGNREARENVVRAIHRQSDQRALFTLGSIALLSGVVLAAGWRHTPAAILLLLIYAAMRALPRFQSAQLYLQNLRILLPSVVPLRAALVEATHDRDDEAEPVAPLARDLRLEGVDVVWGDAGIRGVNASFPKGTITVLVGPTGAGKTTLAEVALGLLSPDAGSLVLDGVTLGGGARVGWRHRCAYVPQVPTLPFATAADNLQWARPGATAEAMMAALDTARAGDVAARGLDANLGAGGSALSGGQRQRLAIAMAVLRGAEFLVLDEPTSAQDPETQDRLVESLRSLRGHTTVLVIAHHPALLKIADQVVEIREGRVQARPQSSWRAATSLAL
ncbi:MAG: ATP-binding cassette domain-containing protein [Thermoplasmatota archaeon]